MFIPMALLVFRFRWLKWSGRTRGEGRGRGIGYSGLGAWHLSPHWMMHQALSNKTLEKYGFILPWHFA